MRDIVLVAPQIFSLLELVAPFDGKLDYRIVLDQDRFSIEKSSVGKFVEFERIDDVALYYDDEEGDLFKGSIVNPVFYIIRFKDIEFLKEILKLTMNRSDVYLDNDFGMILTGSKFLETLNMRPGWDWALD